MKVYFYNLKFTKNNMKIYNIRVQIDKKPYNIQYIIKMLNNININQNIYLLLNTPKNALQNVI